MEGEEGGAVEKQRKKKKRKIAPPSLQQMFGWVEGLPWKDANPSDPAALFLGSQEGGFVCLEEVDADCMPDSPRSFRNIVARQGREDEDDEGEGMEIAADHSLDPSFTDGNQDDRERGSRKRKMNISSRGKKRSERKEALQAENPVMDRHKGQDELSCGRREMSVRRKKKSDQKEVQQQADSLIMDRHKGQDESACGISKMSNRRKKKSEEKGARQRTENPIIHRHKGQGECSCGRREMFSSKETLEEKEVQKQTENPIMDRHKGQDESSRTRREMSTTKKKLDKEDAQQQTKNLTMDWHKGQDESSCGRSKMSRRRTNTFSKKEAWQETKNLIISRHKDQDESSCERSEMPSWRKKKEAKQQTENFAKGQAKSACCYQGSERPKDDSLLTATDVDDEMESKTVDLSAWDYLRLHSKIRKALASLGFTKPTPIQKSCIPAAAHKGKDIIGAAETGSGKTLCYVIPILQRLLEEEDKIYISDSLDKSSGKTDKRTIDKGRSLRALIIAPTRELALQVCEHFRAVAKYTRVNVVPIVGGMSTQKQQRLLKQSPQAVVGTPGRLWQLMSAGESHLLELHELSFLVLDEADRMVEKGHFQELQSIIDMLPRSHHGLQGCSEIVQEAQPYTFPMDPICNIEDEFISTENIAVNSSRSWKRRQTFVFSATLALPQGFRKKLKNGLQGFKSAGASGECSIASVSERAGVQHDAAIVDLTTKNIIATKVEESVIECAEGQKEFLLYYILKLHGCGRTIVFCTSIASVHRISAVLRTLRVSVWSLHAQMQQKQRLKSMDRFCSNEDGVLITTDVAARGLDIVGVRTVIHYQLPHSAEVYVHRSGRTARASSDGCSIALVSPPDKRKYSVLCQALSKENGLQHFPIRMEYMPAIEKRVHLACQLDQLLHSNSQMKAKMSWLKRNAEALEIDIDCDMMDDKRNDSSKESYVKGPHLFEIKNMQKELGNLLEQPLEPRSLSRRFITGAGLSSFVAQQLQEYVASTKNGKLFDKKKRNSLGENRNRLVVIGQEMIEPLMALKAQGL